MSKLERQHLTHYLDSNFAGVSSAASADWFWLGDDIEDMTVDLSPDTETKKNIKGQTSVNHKGYEPSISADPYYANTDDGDFYEKVKDIAFNRKKGADCKTTLLEVIIDKTTGSYDGWIEDVYLVPQSYGGGTEGVNIPFNIMFAGNRKQVTVAIASDGTPTVTIP